MSVQEALGKLQMMKQSMGVGAAMAGLPPNPAMGAMPAAAATKCIALLALSVLALRALLLLVLTLMELTRQALAL